MELAGATKSTLGGQIYEIFKLLMRPIPLVLALSIFFKSLLTGTNMSESACQATLVTAMDTLGVESNTAITLALGTPIPRTTLSNES